jgi:DNA repair exonuclease SbcCD ATPase subunit
MPTNREWLEHTERAAWDTVQSLRRQIEEERTRVARLTPVRESWQRILEILDVAKAEHGIPAEQYADVVEGLCAELRKVKEEREQLAYKLDAERKASHVAGQRVEVVRIEEERPRTSRSVRWFADSISELRRQQAERGQAGRSSLDRVARAMEAKVDELDGASAAEVGRIAVELGALALRATEISGTAKSREGLGPEEEE